MSQIVSIFLIVFMSTSLLADISSTFTKEDCSKPSIKHHYWNGVKAETILLMGQPMIAPRPKITKTDHLAVQSMHDGKWIQFRFSWSDKEKSDGGKLATFSDGVAMQFPVKDDPVPPPVFMGGKEQPVHILNWKAMFQKDKEQGMRTMKDYYPNINVDIYPMEFSDYGKLKNVPDHMKESFSTGKAAGNPQSYAKMNGIDEIKAEGFGSSQVMEIVDTDKAQSDAIWENGKWTVVIARPLKRSHGSMLTPGKNSFMGFAVWQGGEGESDSRKSVTMSWTPLQLSAIQ